MATFTWVPDYNASVDHDPKVNRSNFGDGYSQRALDGINADLKQWSLTFSNRSMAEGSQINDFLKDKAGATSFDWLDPDGETKKYLCENWRKSYPQFDVITINCTFKEVPA